VPEQQESPVHAVEVTVMVKMYRKPTTVERQTIAEVVRAILRGGGDSIAFAQHYHDDGTKS
jgi:hypothetical protein